MQSKVEILADDRPVTPKLIACAVRCAYPAATTDRKTWNWANLFDAVDLAPASHLELKFATL